MPINLNETEKRRKQFFKRLALLPTFNQVAIDIFSSDFHRVMQNPVNKKITFNNISRGLLHNGNLSCLSEYFNEEGNHLFGRTVQALNITNVCLKGYNNGIPDQMPDGTEYIARLIEKNPNIETIDLSYTQLGDDEAKILLNALTNNTKLLKLSLDGNMISKSYLDQINIKLEENIKNKKESDPAWKLNKYLQQSIQSEASSSHSVRLFKFREREVAAKTQLIGLHLEMMNEIKAKRIQRQ